MSTTPPPTAMAPTGPPPAGEVMRRVVAAAVGAVLAVGALSACGSATDRAEDAMNDALSGSGSVDLDADGGIKVEASDGSAEIGTGNLPEGWPSDVPQPEGYTLVGSFGDTKSTWTASWNAEGDRMAEVPAYIDAIVAQGFVVEDTGSVPGTYRLSKGDRIVVVLAALVPDGSTNISVSVAVA